MSQESSRKFKEDIELMRSREYKFVRELSDGSSGATILLHDDLINDHIVCKKFVPYEESERQRMFSHFSREIKLMYKVYHENVVRIFNHYLYPDRQLGYIIMEYIEGLHIDAHIKKTPQSAESLFSQAIDGFAHLESKNVLHRDIRNANIIVRTDGTLKIIDLGFGKRILDSKDYDKSISLNWWCDLPDEIAESKYDFATEIYFVGMLFAKLLEDHSTSGFKYQRTLAKMCQKDPSNRFRSFAEIKNEMLGSGVTNEISFSDKEVYGEFADGLSGLIVKIANDAKYVDDPNNFIRMLEELCQNVSFETEVPNPVLVSNLLIIGHYYTRRRATFEVSCLDNFLKLLKSSDETKRKKILASLSLRLDSITRYDESNDGEHIPF